MDHADGYTDPPPDLLEWLFEGIFPEAVRQLSPVVIYKVPLWREADLRGAQQHVPTAAQQEEIYRQMTQYAIPPAVSPYWRTRDRQQIRDHDRAFLADLHIRWDWDITEGGPRS